MPVNNSFNKYFTHCLIMIAGTHNGRNNVDKLRSYFQPAFWRSDKIIFTLNDGK